MALNTATGRGPHRGRSRKRARERAEFLAFRGALALLERLPERASRRAGQALGDVAWALLRRRRATALENLRLVFADGLEATELERIGRGSLRSLGRLVAEFARFPRADRAWVERHVVYDGLDRYLEAKARGRGVLYLAAHFGSWELIPYAQALLGHPMAFVVRPADNPLVEAVVCRIREACGNAAIPKRDAMRSCLHRLRRGETVGLLIDQWVPEARGLPVTLLGQETHVTSALAALALRTGAPVLPAFAFPETAGRTRIELGPEVELERTGNRERDVLMATRRLVAVVEERIRRSPESWLWIHRRFRRGQEGSPGGAARAAADAVRPLA